MIKKAYWFIVILLCTTLASTAQQYFTAVIKDSLTGEPLIGVTIAEMGIPKGTNIDKFGKISILYSKSGRNITIFHTGYIPKNLLITDFVADSLYTIYLSPDNKEIETVTIVSSVRTNSRIENIPTRVEVLGLDDLDEENGIKPGNIMSLLGDIAGIQMQQVSASSGNTYARIQGLNGRYTQLLKDGIPLFGGLSGSFGILQIPPLDLKQIEIIKGSVSTLYGGDAIGGIINLVSKEPSRKPSFSITLNRSTLAESNINAYYSERHKKIGFTFFAGQTWQKEKDIDGDGLSDVARVASTVLHPKLVFYFNPKSSLTFNYTVTFDARKGGDMNYFAANTASNHYHVATTSTRQNADAKWLYDFSKKSDLTVKLSTSIVQQHLDTKFYAFTATQKIYYSELSYVRKRPGSDWVAGINVNGDVFTNKTTSLFAINDYSFSTLGAFVQNTWRATKHFTVESGFRSDYHSKYGFFPLPRLSLMYKFSNTITGRVNGGLGYKTANLLTYIDAETDLNHIVPGTELVSEKSQGINADVNYHKTFSKAVSLTFNQSFFYTNISSPVYDSSPSAEKVTLSNAAKSLRTQGLQTYARIQYHDIELYLGYVYTNVKKLYDSRQVRLPVTPKHNFSTTLLYEPSEKWRVGIESSFIAGQLDENYVAVKNYVLFAAMFQYNTGKLSLVLNGENLADFRQGKYGEIYSGSISNPVFKKLWAPIDGRVINLSAKWSL